VDAFHLPLLYHSLGDSTQIPLVSLGAPVDLPPPHPSAGPEAQTVCLGREAQAGSQAVPAGQGWKRSTMGRPTSSAGGLGKGDSATVVETSGARARVTRARAIGPSVLRTVQRRATSPACWRGSVRSTSGRGEEF